MPINHGTINTLATVATIAALFVQWIDGSKDGVMDVTTALGLVGVAALTVPLTVASFTPTAAPRFDTFADRLGAGTTSKWKRTTVVTPEAIEDDAQAQENCVWEVEEVMRSCGGAVQGLRECPLMSSVNQERVYLNRANNGFVYWNCGSYSLGPERLLVLPQSQATTPTNDAASSPFHFLASIQLDANERVIFDYQLENGIVMPSSSISLWTRVQRSIARSNDSVSSLIEQRPLTVESDDDDVDGSSSSSCNNIVWSDHTRCRMASPLVPWSLQRATWEKQVDDNASSTTTTLETDREKLNNSNSATSSLDSGRVQRRSYMAWMECGSSCIGDCNMSSTEWRCTVVNQDSGNASGIVRRYDNDGSTGQVTHVVLRRGVDSRQSHTTQ
jgi:hypothetical protein